MDILMYGSFVSYAFWIWRMRGSRWFTAGLMMLIEVPVLGACFIAGMAVTGVWL